jgi:hypothetical protein
VNPGDRRPWTQRVLDLVADGVHDRDELIERATPWVPQGHAYRVRERVRQNELERTRAQIRGRGPSQRRSAVEVHRIGARIVIRDTLRMLVKHRRLVRIGDRYLLPPSLDATRTARPEAGS